MRASQIAGLLTLSAASIATTVSTAGAEVIVYDNFDGTFHWDSSGGLFTPGPKPYLDITLPPTQSGTSTPLALRMNTPTQITGTGYVTYTFVAGETSTALVARSGPVEFRPTTAMIMVTTHPARPYGPTELVGPAAEWNASAGFRYSAGGGTTLFGSRGTIGVKLVTAEGVRYGWVYLEGAGTYQPKAWAYETEFDVPIAAYGTPDRDGVLHVPSEYSTLRDAFNAVISGQTILLANGTYTGIVATGLDFNGKAVTLRSEGGPQGCILDAGTTLPTRGFRCRSGEGASSIIDGITIRNCRAWDYSGKGGALMIEANSHPTVRNCVFDANKSGFQSSGDSSFGGAVYISSNSSAVIDQSLFIKNGATNGGAIYSTGTLTLRDSTLTTNTFGGAPGSFSPYAVSATDGSVVNSIIHNGTSSINPTTTMSITYSCIQGGFAGVGNIAGDPMFVSASDYHLAVGSPCIDAASNPDVPRDVTEDLDGNPRFRNDPATLDTGLGRAPIVDMGAYEFQPPFDPADLDLDDDVDGFDLALLLGQWTGAAKYVPCSPHPAADLNRDCKINGLDLAILLGAWG